MSEIHDPSETSSRARAGEVTAAVGLLLMAVIAALANFGAIESLRVPGDADATAANLVNSAGLFRLGAIGMAIVAVLDIVVAWGLYAAFRHEKPVLSMLTGIVRVVYGVVFAVAISRLFPAVGAAQADPGKMMNLLAQFDSIWMASLIIFAVHLVLLGILVWRPGVFSRIVAILLLVAGAGYLVDSLGTLLSTSYALNLATFTFVGEVVLIVWLFMSGGRRRKPASAN